MYNFSCGNYNARIVNNYFFCDPPQQDKTGLSFKLAFNSGTL